MNCNCHNRDGRNCIELVPIFSNLNEEEMLEVARITTDRKFHKGQMIYMAGDKGEKLYVIHKGKVKITRYTETGKEQVIRILGPGEFMGELSLFSSTPLKDNGEALEETTMCIIDGNQFKILMKKYPDIGFKIMKELSHRLEKAESLIENISLHSVEKRLATTLLNMANRDGEVKLKMSKRDLASHIGMSQETLSRKLSAFQELGIIRLIGHRRIIILNRAALEEIE
ncbi:MAG TPA: Crp/Fnr family transcriptional regulator [Tissierellaceae bacterium]|nr:Crp/Fnr family transcriptional regulator [Tissierellaceae bacterium]